MSANWKKRYKKLLEKQQREDEQLHEYLKYGTILFLLGIAGLVYSCILPLMIAYMPFAIAVMICIPIVLLIAICYRKIVYFLLKKLLNSPIPKKKILDSSSSSTYKLLDDISESLKKLKLLKNNKKLEIRDNKGKIKKTD